jgi:hypothetical protein
VTSDAYAFLTVTPTTSQQMTQGRKDTRRVRRNGWITVKLCTPPNIGTGRPLVPDDRGPRDAELADTAVAILEMVDMPSPAPGDEPVTTLAANRQPIGTDGRWYMSLVRVPFWYVETK